MATGMYYTQAGGDIMHVEASILPGKGELVLTGQLGEVMKESGRAALTYARTRAPELGVPASRIEGRDFHVHVPAGAIPKDGPSAGVTMALALLSALSSRPIRSDLAMTGEITLRGRVLPIGGVKEKVLGAHRAGIPAILLPRDNEADLDDIDEGVKRDARASTWWRRWTRRSPSRCGPRERRGTDAESPRKVRACYPSVHEQHPFQRGRARRTDAKAALERRLAGKAERRGARGRRAVRGLGGR